MQLIAPRLGHDADLRAGALPVFGGVGVSKSVELAHGVDAEQLPADPTRRNRKLAGAGKFHAVQQEHVFRRPPPRHRKRVAVARTGLRALHGAVIDRTRVQRQQVVEAAPVQRQIFHLALPHQPGFRRCGDIHHQRPFVHHDLLRV